MPTHMLREVAASLHSFFLTLLERPAKKVKPRAPAKRHSRFESLEGRAMMATDFAAITGIVFKDVTGNGLDVGVEEVGNAEVRLYLDDGDGLYDAGDTLVDTQNTVAAGVNEGRYRFDGLSAGNYFVRQPAQVVGAVNLLEEVSSLVTITPLQAQGITGTSIDSFTTLGPALSVSFPVGSTDNGVQAGAEVLGGERDLFAELTSNNAADNIGFEGIAGQLYIDANLNATGIFVATYDGTDADATTLDPTGLGGIDLTSAGTQTAFQMVISSEQPNATATIRVYTSAVDYSELTIGIPDANSTELLFNFDDFVDTGLGADFTNVGAIVVTITTTEGGNDVGIELLGTLGPTVQTVDIDNFTPIDLRLTKTVLPTNPNNGQNVTYTLTVFNDGTNAATGVVVTDLLPVGTTYVSDTGAGAYVSGTGIWTVGNLAVGASASIQIVASFTGQTAILNAAEVTAADQFDIDSTPNNGITTEDDYAEVTFTPAVTDLAISKTVDDTTPNENQEVVFTLTVTNESAVAATGVVVTDLLPAGLTYVSDTGAGAYVSGTGIWTIGNLAAGANAVLTIRATVTSSATITNIAEITATDQFDSDSTVNNGITTEDDYDSVILTPNVNDLGITKTVDDATPNNNQVVVFTLTVTNNTGVAATGVQVTDQLPAGLVYVSDNGGGAYVSGTGIWTIGNLAAGASTVLTINARVTSSSQLTNNAEITAVDQFDSNPNNNEDDAVLDPNIADLSLTKTVSDTTPDQNQQITYTITIENDGPQDATNIAVTDVLPAGLTFVSSAPSVGTYNQATGVWTIPSLTNGSSATLQVTATVTTSTVKVNTAQVTAADQFDIDSTPNNNNANEDDQASATVTPNISDLSVTKTVSNTTPDFGSNVTYTVTLSNAGPAGATDVTLLDLLPAGVTYVSSTPSVGTYNQVTGIWTVPTLASGASATLQIVATVTSYGTSTNTAQVQSSDQFDPDSTPGNSVATEDDQASIALTPPRRMSKRLFLAR